MTVATHCLPNGVLGTDEVPVGPVGPASVTINRPGGLVRGVVVAMHGASESPQPTPPVLATANSSQPAFNDYTFQLMNSLTADHWIWMQVALPEDFYSLFGGPSTWMFNDVVADSGHGSRYIAMTGRWWDHIVAYIETNIAAGVPIIPFGGSGGGWHTLMLANTKTSTIAGYAGYIPAGIWATLNPAFLLALSFNTINCTGLTLGLGTLDAVRVPGLVSYGTSDEVVGWTGTTVGALSSGVPVSSFSGSGVLHTVTNAGLTSGPSVQLTGLSGGTSGGIATVTFSGFGTNQLTGCTTTYGSGTLVTGAPVYQNTVDGIITHAQAAGAPVTRLQTTDFHELTSSTATSISNWFASTLDPLYPAVF